MSSSEKAGIGLKNRKNNVPRSRSSVTASSLNGNKRGIIPSAAKRMPVLRDDQDRWLYDRKNQCPGKPIKLNAEMRKMKKTKQRRKSNV